MRNRLTQIKIKNAGDGKLEDGGGLRFVKKGAAGKWVYRYSHLGKRREMGLGAWPAISLSAARTLRDEWAAHLAAGHDPIEVRRDQQDQARAERERQNPTFSDLVDLVFDAKRDGLRGGGTRGRWRSPLDLYAIPAFGRKPCSEVTQRDLVDALRPIWRTKYPTAEKVVQRVKIVLRSGKRMGFQCDPDIVDAAIEMLGVVKHVPTPMRAVPWQHLPDLYAKLGQTTAGRCNQWIILTLVRMEAARCAAVSEIDGDVWTVPADRIKGQEGRVADFRVPLSPPAVQMAQEAREFDLQYLFQNSAAPITNAAVEKCLRTMKAGGTPHGFRTSFRMWTQETQSCSWEVAETVLGHTIGGKVERAYARSDLLDQRRIVMDQWARFVTGQTANVVPLVG